MSRWEGNRRGRMDRISAPKECQLQLAGRRFLTELLTHFEQDPPDRGVLVESASVEKSWEDL